MEPSGPLPVTCSSESDILGVPCSSHIWMPRYLRAEAGVKGVIFRNGRVLLLHRRDDLALVPGLWDLPGGGVEVGASLEGTLVREVREETGFAVTVGRPILAWIASARTTRGKRFSAVIVCYECRTRATGRPRLDAEEHTEFAWVRREELARYPLPPNQLKAIRKAIGRQARAARSLEEMRPDYGPASPERVGHRGGGEFRKGSRYVDVSDREAGRHLPRRTGRSTRVRGPRSLR